MKKLLRDCAVIGSMFLVLLGILFAISGRKAVEKVLTECVMPVGLLWIAIFLITLQAVRKGQRSLAFSLFVLWSLLTVVGNGMLGQYMLTNLENPFAKTVPTEMQKFDQIVVLGGGTNEARNGVSQVNGSGDRVVTAARMYHAGLTKSLICTGTRIKSLSRAKKDASSQIEEILLGLGVPATSLDTLEGQTTSEEMRNLAQWPDVQNQRIGIITSAWHLPRALRLAKAQGLDLIPVPANFRSPPEYDEPPSFGEIVRGLIPKSEGIDQVSVALKENLARLVGR